MYLKILRFLTLYVLNIDFSLVLKTTTTVPKEANDKVLNFLVSKSSFLDGLFINLFHQSFFSQEYPFEIITNKEDKFQRFLFSDNKKFCRVRYYLLPIDGTMYSFETSDTFYLSMKYRGRGKDGRWWDLFYGNYPSGIEMELCSWKEGDTEIEKNPFQRIEPRDEQRMVNVFSSSTLVFLSFFVNWTLGWKPVIIIFCLFLTSIEYHYWGRHRLIDSIMACITAIYFYSLYDSIEARGCLGIGLLFYLLEFILIQKGLIRFDSLQANFLAFLLSSFLLSFYRTGIYLSTKSLQINFYFLFK